MAAAAVAVAVADHCRWQDFLMRSDGNIAQQSTRGQGTPPLLQNLWILHIKSSSPRLLMGHTGKSYGLKVEEKRNTYLKDALMVRWWLSIERSSKVR